MSRNRALVILVVLVAAALVVCGGCAKRKMAPPVSELPSAPAQPRAAEPGTQEEALPQQQQAVEEESTAEKIESGIRDAFFAFDDYSLSEEARTILAADAKLLGAGKSVKFTIEGHCDERGTVEYNLALGEKRAQAAKNYLVSYGIDASRISTISYGKERPFAAGHDEESWAQNRRAHFVIQK